MGINTFFQNLVPKEKKFFPLFNSLSGHLVKAANTQLEVLDHEDPVKQKDLLKQIIQLETEADNIAQNLYDELAKTFLTPFDREDIQALTTSLSGVLDQINKVATQLRFYKPEKTPPEFKDMAVLIQKGAVLVNEVVQLLNDIKKPNRILKACKKMTELEAEATQLYHSSIAELFKKEKDPVELVKKKDILESLKTGTNRIKDVSIVVKTIIIKMA